MNRSAVLRAENAALRAKVAGLERQVETQARTIKEQWCQMAGLRRRLLRLRPSIAPAPRPPTAKEKAEAIFR